MKEEREPMKKVQYLGKKKSFPVLLPIGAKSRGDIDDTMMVKSKQIFELPESEANKLIELDPYNFGVPGSDRPKHVERTKEEHIAIRERLFGEKIGSDGEKEEPEEEPSEELSDEPKKGGKKGGKK